TIRVSVPPDADRSCHLRCTGGCVSSSRLMPERRHGLERGGGTGEDVRDCLLLARLPRAPQGGAEEGRHLGTHPAPEPLLQQAACREMVVMSGDACQEVVDAATSRRHGGDDRLAPCVVERHGEVESSSYVLPDPV